MIPYRHSINWHQRVRQKTCDYDQYHQIPELQAAISKVHKTNIRDIQFFYLFTCFWHAWESYHNMTAEAKESLTNPNKS